MLLVSEGETVDYDSISWSSEARRHPPVTRRVQIRNGTIFFFLFSISLSFVYSVGYYSIDVCQSKFYIG